MDEVELAKTGGWIANLVEQYLTHGAMDVEQAVIAVEQWKDAVGEESAMVEEWRKAMASYWLSKEPAPLLAGRPPRRCGAEQDPR